MVDRIKSKIIACKGGLDVSQDALTQGTLNIGTATTLQNYEPSLQGGYAKILGYSKFDSTIVPGVPNLPILGIKVCFNGVVAAKGTEVYYSTGTGWTQITTTSRTGTILKYRFSYYDIATTPAIIMCDGVNYAAKWDGTTYTLINGSGAPTDPKYVIGNHLYRAVLAGYTSNIRAISISAPNSDTNFAGGSGAIELVVGDIVTGLKSFRGTLYIFCENSIWKLTGSSSSDFALTPITRSIGCVSGDTIQEIGGDLIFLAPDGLRSLAATDRIGDVDLALQSQPIQSLIRPYIGSYLSHYFSSCLIRKKSQYRLFMYDTTTDISSKYGTALYGSGIYGLRSNDTKAPGFLGKLTYGQTGPTYEWASLLGINVYCADSEYINNQELIVFGHPANSYIYKLESGDDLDGTAIQYIYKSPKITFDDASLRKVLQKIIVNTQVTGDIGTSLQVTIDEGDSTVIQPPAVPLTRTGNLSRYGTAIYGTSTYSPAASPIFKKNLIGSGFTFTFTFSGSDSFPSHRIDSFQVEYLSRQPDYR